MYMYSTCTTVGKLLTINFHLCAKTHVFKVEVVVIHDMIASCFENAPRSFHVKRNLYRLQWSGYWWPVWNQNYPDTHLSPLLLVAIKTSLLRPFSLFVNKVVFVIIVLTWGGNNNPLLNYSMLYFQDGSVCYSSITALAVRYSEELKTSVDSVTMALEELQQCLVKGNTELFYSVRLHLFLSFSYHQIDLKEREFLTCTL